jgi:hypothetical protein
MTHAHWRAEAKLNDLKVESQNTGMNINSQRTKEMRVNLETNIDYILEVMKLRKFTNSAIWGARFLRMEVPTKVDQTE